MRDPETRSEARAAMTQPTALPQPSSGWRYAGWRNLAAGFVCSVLLVGSTIYSFGLYVVPFNEAFGLTRAQANVGMMIFAIAIAVWSPFVGSLLDRVPAPGILCAGGALLGVGLCTIANTASLHWVCVAIAGPLALGMACAGPLAASTVVARWFRRRRGRAMGLVAVSTAAGGFVMTQVGAYLILHYGWRQALNATGIGASLVVCCIALLFIRSRPSEEELRAGGEVGEMGDPELAAGSAAEWSTRQLLRAPNFWFIAFGAGLLLASDQALLISKIPYLLDIGIELQAASFLVACQSASSMAGKLGVGFAADRVDLRKLFALVAAAHLILLGALILKPGYWTLLVVFSCVGIAVGGVHPILTMLIAAAFGSRSYGSAYGRMNLVMQPISLLALYFIGAVYDRSGVYDAAFWVFGGLIFVGIALISAVRLHAPGAAGQRESVSL
jgi:MFS family permease